MKITDSLKRRFNAKVFRTARCWLWTAGTRPDGYGVMGLGSRKDKIGRVHRISWEIYRGPIPKNRFVLHKCENRRCVRPSHLKLGTQKQNIADSLRTGSFPLGTKNGQTKNTSNEIREIRRLGQLGWSSKKIAPLFSLHRVTISRILRRATWDCVK
jgi:hypothetical protein